jgi:arylformamidase
MRVVDLSHVIEEGMPVFPGDAPPRLEAVCTVEQCGFYERKLVMGSHTGTHMDAPAHMISAGACLDAMPAERFAGPGRVVDVRQFNQKRVPLDYLEAQDLDGAEFVLLYSGWDSRWGRDAYFHDYPVLSIAAAKWLAGLGLKGLGLDMISADPAYPPEAEIHHALLGSGMVLIENLCGLDGLPASGFTFCAQPLKLKDADGSPVRAVAIMD